MTAPDSPAVAAVRQMAVRFRDGAVLVQWRGADICRSGAEALDGVLAELDEARRKPRVWLPGDVISGQVWVADSHGGVHCLVDGDVVRGADGPLVEVLVPDVAAAVAAERERRALDRAESPQTPSRQSATDSGAIAPQRRSEGQPGASSVEPEATR